MVELLSLRKFYSTLAYIANVITANNLLMSFGNIGISVLLAVQGVRNGGLEWDRMLPCLSLPSIFLLYSIGFLMLPNGGAYCSQSL